jgi:hypothetical protein
MARTHQHALGSKNVTELFAHNTYCYVKQLEVTYRCGLVVCSGVITVPRQLRTDKHISGNRGSGEVAKKRCISSYLLFVCFFLHLRDCLCVTVFGGRLDTWDEFSDINVFGHDTELEVRECAMKRVCERSRLRST